MAAEVQHTLLNLEITPPPGAWNTIAARLDTEFDADETALSGKLTEFEMAPPPAAWQNIEAAIVNDPKQVEAAPAIIINRSFRRWAAAAASYSTAAWSICEGRRTAAPALSAGPRPRARSVRAAP